jgi:hypothetical protein
MNIMIAKWLELTICAGAVTAVVEPSNQAAANQQKDGAGKNSLTRNQK